MKKIILLILIFLPIYLFANVRGLIPLDSSVTWPKFDTTNEPTSNAAVIYNNDNLSWINLLQDLLITDNRTWSSEKIDSRIPSAKVIIRSESDFPAAVGGVITLENNTTYVIDSSLLIMTSRLEIPTSANVKIEGSYPQAVIYYVGADSLISGTSINSLLIKDATLIAPNGSIWNITGRNTDSSYIACSICIFQASNLGTVHDIAFFVLDSIYQGFSQGIEFEDNTVVAHIAMNFFATTNTPGCVYFTYKGTIPFITMDTLLLTSFASNETIFDLDSNLINLSGLFSGINAIGVGTVFKAGSLDQKHITFKFLSCVNIADSTVKGTIYFQNHGDPQVIAVQSVPQLIEAPYLCENVERLTCNPSGNIIYTGTETTELTIVATVLGEGVAGGLTTIALYVAKVTTGSYTVTFTNGTNLVNEVGHSLSNGDQIRFENFGGAMPTGIFDHYIYYVINANTDDFQVSLTSGGAAVTFSDDGSGTNTYSLAETLDIFEVKASVTKGSPQTMIVHASDEMNTGDYFLVLIENESAAGNIDVTDMSVLINK